MKEVFSMKLELVPLRKLKVNPTMFISWWTIICFKLEVRTWKHLPVFVLPYVLVAVKYLQDELAHVVSPYSAKRIHKKQAESILNIATFCYFNCFNICIWYIF